ncbi:MAG TPA: TIGR01777 family oxidoreductase [Pyrinomonadaceae bacterium]
MRIIIPAGTGQVGTVLAHFLQRVGHEVVVLSRTHKNQKYRWDGETHGEWVSQLEGADVVINLAGQSVNCRYTPENRRRIMDSRIKSTRVLGEAMAQLSKPPRVWLQASTATIYTHRYDAPNDDATGILGGRESNAPDTWRFSIDVATNWERTCNEANTPQTRKVLMRSAIIMSPTAGGPFDLLLRLVRFGLGGTVGDGRQFVSWIHDLDFARAVLWLIEREEFHGPVNVAAPNPLPNKEFMRDLREAWGISFGLPATEMMLEIGAFVLRSESELALKSRYVIPSRLIESGFVFNYPVWKDAAADLCYRWRTNVN